MKFTGERVKVFSSLSCSTKALLCEELINADEPCPAFRVSKMQIRVIEIEDPVEQTLFEVYASLELETKNEWGTH